MPLTTFKVGKREFVVIARRVYDQLTRAERDQKDARIAEKGMQAYLSGKVKGIPLSQARRKWGV